jgi:hypothetical protein
MRLQEAAGLLGRAQPGRRPEEHAGADHAEIRARRARTAWPATRMGAARTGRRRRVDEEADPERAAKVLTMLATCQWSLGLADRSRATQRHGLEPPARTR